jgi:arabinofuranosyltransferase
MSQSAFSNSQRHTAEVTYAVILASLVLAYFNRFVQDDAFISFRYAYNLTVGDGLVWNPGERVEGYTNFLWTLMMSVPISLGRDAVVFSQIVGLLSFVGSLFFTFKLSKLVYRSDTSAILAVLLLGTNYTFNSYATGGLETQFQTFLIVTLVYLSLTAAATPVIPARRLAAMSLLGAAAVLTRLDSVLAVGPAYLFLLWRLGKKGSNGSRPLNLFAALLPGGIVVGSWLVWKYSYYGDVLPNSYYAKASLSVASFRLGLAHIFHFCASYLLLPFFLIVPFRLRIVAGPIGARILIAILILWIIYVVRVGGDFMEFRLLVPVLPLAMTLLAALIVSLPRRAVRVVLTVLVVVGSLWHAVTFHSVSGISPIRELKSYIEDENQNWDEIGRSLGRLFGGEENGVTIATSAAGAIPYYSRLRTVDMLGVNDKWIAKHGIVWSPRPGHQRMATHEYMRDRGVNLVIGHPRVDRADIDSVGDLERIVHLWMIQPELLPSSAGVLEIPVGAHHKVSVLYLVPSEAVDRAVTLGQLKFHPLFPERS